MKPLSEKRWKKGLSYAYLEGDVAEAVQRLKEVLDRIETPVSNRGSWIKKDHLLIMIKEIFGAELCK